MHCPQCGQQQMSDEVRFCKSCGFPLDVVRELLTSGGVSLTVEKESIEPRQSPRRQGVRQGVILLFIMMVLMPLTMILGRQGTFLPPMFFMAGLMRILYAVIFQEGAPRKTRQPPNTLSDAAPGSIQQLGTPTRGTALPPAQSIPFATFNTRRADTREMVTPPSVTEHTTKLLNESPEPK